MMPAGRRDRKIAFYRNTTSENAMGEPVKGGETQLAEAFAAVIWGAGREIRQAAIEGNDQAATFVVLSTASTRSVLTTDFLRFDGADWDISAIAQRGRLELEFTATRRA